MKITQFDDLYPNRLVGGDTILVSASGSNTGYSGGDVLGEPGELAVVGLRRVVSLQSNLASGASIGDVLTIVQTAGQVEARFAVSSNVGAIPAAIVDAKGDLIAATAADTVTRLAVGSNGHVLAARSTETTGLAWEPQYATLNFVIDGGGSAIATGIKGDVVVDFACTVVGVTTLADQSGSIVVDIWKDTYANFPPTDADSITSATPPTLSTATKAQDTTLTSWITSISAGDILRFNVDSATAVTRVTVALKVRRG